MKVSRMRKIAASLAVVSCLLLPGTALARSPIPLNGGTVPVISESPLNVQCEPEGQGMRCTIVLSDGTAKDVYIADP